uniref:Ig-like domain-containing protein n=1 Tax=Acanthochromis polyacanthus TaxID=80966 RepID=A0A3Q1GMY2_9TELE
DETKTPVNVSSPLLITVNRGEEVQMRLNASVHIFIVLWLKCEGYSYYAWIVFQLIFFALSTETPDTVSVSAVHPGPMVEGTNFYLKCDISNVAPVQKLKVKWYRDNETVSGEMFLDTNKTPQNVFSTHIITPERDYDGSQYRCEAELHLGPNGPDVIPTEISEPYTAIVHYKPFIKACPSSYTAVEDQLSMDMLPCSAGGNPPPTVQWYHQGKLINSSEPLTRFDTGKYTAEIRNILGSVSTSLFLITFCIL